MHADRTNRLMLALSGLVVLAAGVAGMAASTGVFGASFSRRTLFDNQASSYVGHHGGEALNPLTGKMEPNGTSIVDVTDPKKPKYLVHIPGEPKEKTGEFGGASMVRVCSGDELPHGIKGKYYMLRAYGNTRHEMWDVTDPAKPALLNVMPKTDRLAGRPVR